MTSLPLAVHTAAQVRALDAYAIKELRIPGYTLMTRAGEAAVDALCECWPDARRIVVFCGPGNNGGDGYVLARLARQQQLGVSVVALADPASLRGDARRAWEDYVAAGGTTSEWKKGASLPQADVIVDAIFGTGLSRDIDPQTAACLGEINACEAPVLALDIPSGLNADTGRVLGAAVEAERTITFVGLKLGFYLDQGPNCTGTVMFDDLGLPADLSQSVGVAAVRIGQAEMKEVLPRRRRTTHKGQQGHVLVIGGNAGMAGAARMTGEAALRVGAGLVTVATRAENVPAILSARPELICRAVEEAHDLAPLLDRADVLAIGPGLGQERWSKALLEAALGSGKPAVLDADALNLLASAPTAKRDAWILTPHPGEAGRLLRVSASDIQSDRLGSAQALAARYGGVVVLKGAGTLVVLDGGLPAICDRGNPGMASPGMGDVLTGIIAGIAAQVGDLAAAARVGVLAHALAGDMAARQGERGLIATDLFAWLPRVVNPCQPVTFP